jgi:hypothetical protein
MLQTRSIEVWLRRAGLRQRPRELASRSRGALTQRRDYDSVGNQEDVIDFNGVDTRTLYDNLGRPTATIEDYGPGSGNMSYLGSLRLSNKHRSHALAQFAAADAIPGAPTGRSSRAGAGASAVISARTN